MLKQDQPVYAMSAALDYDSASRLAVYTSVAPTLARLWQGDTTIMGETITVDDSTGNLTAKGKVASTLMLEQRNEKTTALERMPSMASSTDLLYEDGQRRATYTGSAHVAGPQGDLRAREDRTLPEGGRQRAGQGRGLRHRVDEGRGTRGDRRPVRRSSTTTAAT